MTSPHGDVAAMIYPNPIHVLSKGKEYVKENRERQRYESHFLKVDYCFSRVKLEETTVTVL